MFKSGRSVSEVLKGRARSRRGPVRSPDMPLPAPSLPCLEGRGHIFLSYPASSWRAWCLFSRTNIFSRLQWAGLGDLAPTRKKRLRCDIWGCKTPPARGRGVQAESCYIKCRFGQNEPACERAGWAGAGGPPGASAELPALRLRSRGLGTWVLPLWTHVML